MGGGEMENLEEKGDPTVVGKGVGLILEPTPFPV